MNVGNLDGLVNLAQMNLLILDWLVKFGLYTHYFDIQVGNLDGLVNFDCDELSQCRLTC